MSKIVGRYSLIEIFGPKPTEKRNIILTFANTCHELPVGEVKETILHLRFRPKYLNQAILGCFVGWLLHVVRAWHVADLYDVQELLACDTVTQCLTRRATHIRRATLPRATLREGANGLHARRSSSMRCADSQHCLCVNCDPPKGEPLFVKIS